MTTIAIDVPETAFSSLRLAPCEYGEEMKRAAAVKWYELHRLSQSKAAELCGLPRSAFIRLLAEYNVSILQDDESSLLAELASA